MDNNFCPWCIADGSAASKFNGAFVDSYPLIVSGISQKIVDEVCLRTPGFDSWQQEVWLTHCDDAGAFVGDASKDDVEQMLDGKIELSGAEFIPKEIYKEVFKGYQPGGNPCVFKFECIHCNQILLHFDGT